MLFGWKVTVGLAESIDCLCFYSLSHLHANCQETRINYSHTATRNVVE